MGLTVNLPGPGDPNRNFDLALFDRFQDPLCKGLLRLMVKILHYLKDPKL